MKDDVVVLRPTQLSRDSVIRLQRQINRIHLAYGPLHDLYHRLKRASRGGLPTRH